MLQVRGHRYASSRQAESDALEQPYGLPDTIRAA
jgi:hypothetical protein